MTKNLKQTLHMLEPYYITGFTEADGCFYISLYQDKTSKAGIRITPIFYITQDISSQDVLYNIRHALCGKTAKASSGKFIKRIKDNTLTYTVRGVIGCKEVLRHFDKYPLLGEKLKNYKIFKRIVNMLEVKKHLTDMESIITLTYLMNRRAGSHI